jgi:hypothetical protein
MSFSDSVVDPEEQARMFLFQAMEVTQNETLKRQIHDILDAQPGGVQALQAQISTIYAPRVDSSDVYHAVVAMEDYLWKRGKALHMWSRRYYLLSGNCMYYYAHKNDVRPKGVIFLTGSIVERVRTYKHTHTHDRVHTHTVVRIHPFHSFRPSSIFKFMLQIKDEGSELKGYYGFELLHQDLCTGEHHKHEKRVLYCRKEEDREKWVTQLQHAAHVSTTTAWIIPDDTSSNSLYNAIFFCYRLCPLKMITSSAVNLVVVVSQWYVLI